MKINYYPLVNRMVAAFKMKEKSILPFKKIDSFSKPFITIAREPGSGGAPIAKKVAEKLGYEYVDEQIIDKISHSTKKRKAIVKAIDEKSRSKIEDVVHSLLNKEYIDDITYISELVKIVLAYAHRGNVVILGRGANYICPFGKGLHVNIVAPYDVRVSRAMKYEEFDKKQAKERIREVEKERRDFVKQYFKKDLKRSNAYDLTINTTYYDINKAADLIVEAFYGKFPKIDLYKSILS